MAPVSMCMTTIGLCDFSFLVGYVVGYLLLLYAITPG